MKTILTFALAVIMIVPAFAQQDSGAVIQTLPESDEQSVITVGPETTVVIEDEKDTTRLKIGKKGVVIIEGDKGTQVNIEDLEEVDEDEDFDYDYDSESDENEHTKFKPNWAGFEIGLNNYLNSDMSMSLDNSMSFMDLNTGRSWNFNINFMDYGFGLGTDKIGIVTGLGLEWNNYHFDNDNNITKVDGVIESLPLTFADIKKNRLQTTYLRAPLLLEFQIPAGSKRIYISGGPIAGVKLGSNTKIVYKENGDDQKVKDKDDYNLSSLRYGFTARAGYRGIKLFANYYMTPLFESGKGPELYPISVGITLADF